MCSIPEVSLKTYLYGVVLFVLMGLGLYCNYLGKENDKLTIANSEISKSYDKKVKALTECSDGVKALKDREDELTKNAAVAVEKAKKEAEAHYKAAADILARKPKQPVVTPENEKDYGGNDVMVQLKDYLASHELINEIIDKENHND